MKKLTLLVTFAIIAFTANAQTRQMNSAPKKLNINSKLQKVTDLSHFRASTSNNRAYSGWFNYALQLDDATNGFTPGLAAASFMMVFPDTNLIVGQYTDGTTAYPQFHIAETLLDPKNMPFQSILPTDAYSLDSVGVVYGYLRGTASNVVDTLRVDIIKGDDALLWDLTSSGETYQDIEYTYTTNKIKASNVLATFKYYLTVNDSSSSAAELFLQTVLPTRPAGSRIGAAVTFIPGYTHTITDSVQNKNAFYLLSYEQNGTGTDPVFYGTLSDGTSDMNCSYAIPTSVRYNTNANGWNGYSIPTWAWTTPYAYEHHLIEFKISAPPTPLGITENNFVNGVKVAQNMPNPTSGFSTINFELEKGNTVVFNVFDVTGKKIASQSEGDLAAGSHTIKFNASNLAAGVYYYSLTVGANSTSTMKMVVIK